MNESINFQPVDTQGGKLYVPNHVADPSRRENMASYQFSPSYQELQAQSEVIGTNGLGSIRNESRKAEQEAADLDRDLTAMVDPNNIITLKKYFDNALSKETDQTRRDALKARAIESYTQAGAKKDNPRKVPSAIKRDVARLMDESYDELQARIDKRQVGKNEQAKPKGDKADDKKQTSDKDISGGKVDGEYRLKGSQLFGGGKEKLGSSSEKSRNTSRKNEYGYDGPVKPGMEIEPRASSEVVVWKKPNIEIVPRKNGEIVTKDITSERLVELAGRLSDARSEFIRLAAARKGVSVLSRNSSKEKLAQARAAYDELRDEAGAETAFLLEKAGYSKAEIKALSQVAYLEEGKICERELSSRRQELAEGKKLRPFYDWWARQGADKLFSKAGIKGALKKMAAMGVVGLPVGVAAAAVGTFALGPIMGAALAGMLARGVTRGIANAKVTKEAGSLTQAQTDAEKEYKAMQDRLGDLTKSSDTTLTSAHLSEVIEKGANSSVNRNRRRLAGSVAVGAAAGTLGGIFGTMIHDHIYGGAAQSHTPKAPHIKVPKTVPKPPVAPTTPATINPNNYQGYEYPWNYYAAHYGAGDASPRIIEMAQRAQAAGWKVNSLVVPGPNNDEILNIVAPNGQVYNTTPGIVAALEQFENQ